MTADILSIVQKIETGISPVRGFAGGERFYFDVALPNVKRRVASSSRASVCRQRLATWVSAAAEQLGVDNVDTETFSFEGNDLEAVCNALQKIINRKI